MQSIDVRNPGLPDLQFVLLVLALCTSNLRSLNISDALRTAIFDRCWVLLNDMPPPTRQEDRVLDLRQGTEETLEALTVTVRGLLIDAGITAIMWDHPPSDATRPSSPEASPLIERLQHFDPPGVPPTDSPEKN